MIWRRGNRLSARLVGRAGGRRRCRVSLVGESRSSWPQSEPLDAGFGRTGLNSHEVLMGNVCGPPVNREFPVGRAVYHNDVSAVSLYT